MVYPDLVYKIFRAKEHELFQRQGSFAGSSDDLRDGFIHLSTHEQLQGTLSKHFAGESDVVVLGFRTAALGEALKWEVSRGGEEFPHLYGVLSLEQVV